MRLNIIKQEESVFPIKETEKSHDEDNHNMVQENEPVQDIVSTSHIQNRGIPLRLNIIPINLYIIGKSPIEDMDDAVEREYIHGVRPLVDKGKQINLKHTMMETYVRSLAIYSVRKHDEDSIFEAPEGCKADLIFTKDGENYLGIQIKTTSRLHSGNGGSAWRFDMAKEYPGLILLLRCIEDGKCWIITYNKMREHYKGKALCIPFGNGSDNIDWDDYKTDSKSFYQVFSKYFDDGLQGNPEITLKLHDDIINPISKNCQKEQRQRTRLMAVLKETGLSIKFPPVENMIYDFVLGGLKVQEKSTQENVAKTGLTCSIVTTVSYKKKGPYKKGSFDILTIHNDPPYDDSFYFLPEILLLKHGVIKSENSDGIGTLGLHPSEDYINNPKIKLTHNWPIDCLLKYGDPNLLQMIIFIHDIQVRGEIVPIIIQPKVFWDFKCVSFTDIIKKWGIPRLYSEYGYFYNYTIYGKRVMERRCLVRRDSTFNSHRVFLTCIENGQYIAPKKSEADFVYSRLPKPYHNLFYLVPFKRLAKQRIVKDNESQQSFTIPNPDNTDGHWIEKFTFNFDDHEIKDKLDEVFITY